MNANDLPKNGFFEGATASGMSKVRLSSLSRTCNLCGFRVPAYHNAMIFHANSKHLHLPLYYCRVCDKAYTTPKKSNMTKHARLRHDGNSSVIEDNWLRYADIVNEFTIKCFSHMPEGIDVAKWDEHLMELHEEIEKYVAREEGNSETNSRSRTSGENTFEQLFQASDASLYLDNDDEAQQSTWDDETERMSTTERLSAMCCTSSNLVKQEKNVDNAQEYGRTSVTTNAFFNPERQLKQAAGSQGRSSATNDHAYTAQSRSSDGVSCTANVGSSGEICDLNFNDEVLEQFLERKRKRRDSMTHPEDAEHVAQDNELCDYEISEINESEKSRLSDDYVQRFRNVLARFDVPQLAVAREVARESVRRAITEDILDDLGTVLNSVSGEIREKILAKVLADVEKVAY